MREVFLQQQNYREAAKAGVDAIKFQTFEPDQFINSSEKKDLKH